MAFKTILLEKDGPVARVTINQPEKMNPLSPETMLEITAAVGEVARDSEARVLVITGMGRAFSAGGDLRALPGTRGEPLNDIRRFFDVPQALMIGIQKLEKPTIAMVNGAAVGAGLDMACACDIRIGSQHARFLPGFIRIGSFPGTGGTWLLPRVVGVPKAIELILTGDAVDAEEAYRIGLLNRLVPAEDLEKETMALARRLAQGPPVAMALAKMHVYRGLEMNLETAMKMVAACESITLSSEDVKEGVAAFLEKREPVFKGR